MFGRSLSMVAGFLLACVSVPLSCADAQLVGLIPGVRARIRAPGIVNGRVTGVVTNRSTDSLSLATEVGVPVQLPLSAITSIEVSEGKSRARGAMKGALWGTGFGVLSSFLSDGSDEECTGPDCMSRGEVAAFVIVSSAVTGAVIGLFVQSESWQRLDVPVRAALLPTRGGPAAVVSIRF
jgi:hypothetical protein